MGIIERIFKYLADALGITPEEPPVISDHPPIHMVDGEIKLGDSVYQKYVNNWNSAPIKTYERPLISNFTDPIYDDARTHEVVDSKEI